MPTINELIQQEQNQVATVVEPSNTEVTPSGDLQNTETVVTETVVATEQVAAEDNSVNFSFEQAAQETPQAVAQEEAKVSLEDFVSKADKKELLKAAGLDDFDIEFINYRKSGGDPLKYIEAKSFNWDKVSDIDVVRNDYKNQYPTFEAAQIERLIAKKYGFIDGGDEDDNADALLMVKADAHVARERNKQEQQKFQIPTTVQNEPDLEKIRLEAEQVQAAEFTKLKTFYESHEATKALMNSKRVAIKLGDKGSFNFNIDKPEVLTNLLLNGDAWQQVTSTKQGEPDVEKLQRIALYAINPNYDNDLVNYGIALGKKMIVEEGQNARRPIGTQPIDVVDKGLVIKGAGTLKQHMGN